MTTVLKNGLLYTSGHSFESIEAAFSEGVITGLGSGLKADRYIDCSGCFILPGLTDVHLHGCAGKDVCSEDAGSLRAIAEYEFSRGITSFCPATMTLPDEKLERILAGISAFAEKRLPESAEVVGIHLEGSFVSAEKCGAQKAEWLQPASAEKLRGWQRAARGLIKPVTVAPEVSGAMECISECAGEFHFSLGHTACGYETARTALAAGADRVTHLFNAMAPFHHRDTGLIGAAADDPNCFAELICDGIHVSAPAVRAAFKLFGEERIVLISDSMEAAGMPDGEYSLGGQRVIKKGSRAELADGTLAGSVSDLYDCLLTAVKMGIPLENAVRAATENPCRSVGIFDRFGSIEVGKAAHFLILSREELSIRRVI